jgi:hypothetical protein
MVWSTASLNPAPVPLPAKAGLAAQRLAVVSAFAIVAAALFLLGRFPPALSTGYPRCPIYAHLHLLCPGCGTTRALAALVRGHLVEAIRWNALSCALLPFALRASVQRSVALWRGDPISSFPHPARTKQWLALCGAAVLFGLLRNL